MSIFNIFSSSRSVADNQGDDSFADFNDHSSLFDPPPIGSEGSDRRRHSSAPDGAKRTVTPALETDGAKALTHTYNLRPRETKTDAAQKVPRLLPPSGKLDESKLSDFFTAMSHQEQMQFCIRSMERQANTVRSTFGDLQQYWKTTQDDLPHQFDRSKHGSMIIEKAIHEFQVFQYAFLKLVDKEQKAAQFKKTEEEFRGMERLKYIAFAETEQLARELQESARKSKSSTSRTKTTRTSSSQPHEKPKKKGTPGAPGGPGKGPGGPSGPGGGPPGGPGGPGGGPPGGPGRPGGGPPGGPGGSGGGPGDPGGNPGSGGPGRHPGGPGPPGGPGDPGGPGGDPSDPDAAHYQDSLPDDGRSWGSANRRELYPKLLQIDLPNFGGNIRAYKRFKGLFMALVGKNPDLAPITKMSYLVAHLKDQAKDLADAYDVCDENYEPLMKDLDHRYGRPELLVEEEVTKVVNFPRPPDKDSRQLRKFLDTFRATLNLLKQLDPECLTSPYFIQANIKSKMPDSCLIDFEEWRARQIPPIPKDKLINETVTWLDIYLTSRESIAIRDTQRPKLAAKDVYASKPQQSKVKPTTSAFMTQAVTGKCAFCDKNHSSLSCKDKPVASKAIKILTAKSLCRKCFNKHPTRECTTGITCATCGGHHHVALHLASGKRAPSQGVPDSESSPDDLPADVHMTTKESLPVRSIVNTTPRKTPAGDTILPVVRIPIPRASTGKTGKSLSLLTMLDQCASLTFITMEAAAKLKHRVINESFSTKVRTLHGVQNLSASVIECLLPLPRGNHLQVTAVVVEKIGQAPKVDIPLAEHCPQIKLADSFPRHQADIDILLGQPLVNSLLTGAPFPLTNQSGTNEYPDMWLQPTVLGAVPCGVLPTGVNGPNKEHSENFFSWCYYTPTERIAMVLEEMWKIDSMAADQQGLSSDQLEAIKRIEQTLSFDASQGRFVAELLFTNPEGPDTVNNYRQALARLYGLHRQLEKNPDLAQAYEKGINDYLDAGTLETVHDDNPEDPSRPLVYLPHHAVINLDSPSHPYRICWNPALQLQRGGVVKPSLNSQLLTGIPLQPPILDLLASCRDAPYLLTADISKMFNQVILSEKHRNYTRILWKPLGKSGPPDILRLARIGFGFREAPFTSQFVLKTLAKWVKKRDHRPVIQEACNIMLHQVYVDDILIKFHDPEKAIGWYHAIQEILAIGGFVAKKWTCNNAQVLAAIPDEFKATMTSRAVHSTPPQFRDVSDRTKTLGTHWIPAEDTFVFDHLKDMQCDAEWHKRSVASLLARAAFDCLGICAPLVLKARKILKTAWERKLGWRQELCPDLKSQFQEWLQDLTNLPTLKVPRYCHRTDNSEFHIFTDSSQLMGFGAVAFLRTPTKTGFKTQFFMARSRIVPMRKLSLAQLELRATHLGAEIGKTLQTMFNLPSAKFHLWTDSLIAFHWVTHRRPGQLVPWCASKVQYVQDTQFSLRWLPGDWNTAADLASRGATVAQLASPTWLVGPPFLTKPSDEWHIPEPDILPGTHLEGINKIHMVNMTSEEDKLYPHLMESFIGVQLKHGPYIALDDFYSCHDRLIRVTGWMLTWISSVAFTFRNKLRVRTTGGVPDWAKNWTLPFQPINVSKGPYKNNKPYRSCPLVRVVKSSLHEEHTRWSRRFWIKFVQHKAYPQELEDIKNMGHVRPSSSIVKLTPYLDQENCLRVGGRLHRVDLPFSTRHQIILPAKIKGKHVQFTRGLVDAFHNSNPAIRIQNKSPHPSNRYVESKLLESYWIVTIKRLVQRAQRECWICRRLNALAAQQKMSDLPVGRADMTHSFAATALDDLGPIMLRRTQSGPTSEHHVTLFTCMSTRAVHYELIENQKSESFLLAYKRFANRVGHPAFLRSDQQKSYIACSHILQENIDEINKLIREEREQHSLSWEFNYAISPHMNGIVERQVRILKELLAKLIPRRQALTTWQFQYVLSEAEAIVNDTPLYQLAAGEDQYVTPSQLLLGRQIRSIPITFKKNDSVAPLDLRTKFKMKQALLDQFWSLWKKRYLHSLQVQHKWFSRQPCVRPGMLVVVQESLRKRSHWPLFLIHEVRKGRDGLVRNVSLRKGDTIVYHSLPLSRIYPLEVAPYTRGDSDPEKPLASPGTSSSRSAEPVDDNQLTTVVKLDNTSSNPPNPRADEDFAQHKRDSNDERLGPPSPIPMADPMEEDLGPPPHWEMPLEEPDDSMTMWCGTSWFPLSCL